MVHYFVERVHHLTMAGIFWCMIFKIGSPFDHGWNFYGALFCIEKFNSSPFLVYCDKTFVQGKYAADIFVN